MSYRREVEPYEAFEDTVRSLSVPMWSIRATKTGDEAIALALIIEHIIEWSFIDKKRGISRGRYDPYELYTEDLDLIISESPISRDRTTQAIEELKRNGFLLKHMSDTGWILDDRSVWYFLGEYHR